MSQAREPTSQARELMTRGAVYHIEQTSSCLVWVLAHPQHELAGETRSDEPAM